MKLFERKCGIRISALLIESIPYSIENLTYL